MRDLRAIITWLLDQARALLGVLREGALWLALAVGLLLWTLAYQVPYTYQLDLGGDLQSGRRYDDEPFLRNFNDSEPADPIPADTPMLLRWSGDDSRITLPGLGGGRWIARIQAGSGPRPPLSSRWDDGASSYAIPVSGQPREYRLVTQASSAGDLTLHIVTPGLSPPGDPRTLGIVMTRVRIEPIGNWRVPALNQLALLALALALIYLLLRRLALTPRPALVVTLGLAALAAVLLARERMALTLLTPLLPGILAAGYMLGIVLQALHQRLFRMHAAEADAYKPQRSRTVSHPPLVVGLIVLAVALRLGGMMHPHAKPSDDGLNANNLKDVTSGLVYFTEGLTNEAGGGQAPYPPGQYILFAPAQLIIHTVPNNLAALRLLLKICNALWDSMVLGLIWYLLRRSGAGERAALLGAALYLLPPPLLKSLAVGEFANIFGQALALPLLVLLALRARDLGRRPWPIVLLMLLMAALLGHLGITISLACMLAWLLLVWLLQRDTRGAARVLLLAGLLAGALVALFYYTALWDVLAARLAAPRPTADAATALSIGQRLTRQTSYLDAYGIHPLALATGAAGALLLALRRPRAPLGALLVSWWGGTLLSLGLLLYANQAVRWYLFLYPALCIGAGPALAAWWSRGRAGRVLVAALLGLLLWYGLAFWVTQIVDYRHV